MRLHALLAALTGAALAATLIAACADEPEQDRGGGDVASAPTSPPPGRLPHASQAPDPTGIIIPALDARSDNMIPLGLTTDDCPDGQTPCLASPPVDQPMTAGWYAGENPDLTGDEWQPGEPGPAVIAGHVDGIGPDGRKGHPGVFARIRELAPDDQIIIERELAAPLTFVVTAVEKYPKDEFDSAAVYGDTDGPALRLVTCGGDFDDSTGHYVDNYVVFAQLAQ